MLGCALFGCASHWTRSVIVTCYVRNSQDGGRHYALEYLHKERKASLSGLSLAGAYLAEIELLEADLHGADLSGAKLWWADLSEANLYETKLHGAGLTGADLREAYLGYADLSGADLRAADLRGAKLRAADLRGASLYEAGWIKGKLREIFPYRKAMLNEVNLTGADLRVSRFKQAQIDGAFHCEGWPPKLPFLVEPPPTRKCTFWGDPIEK